MESTSAMTIIVAMDGPSGSGKSSTSKTIAKRAGWLYLDTGALYRAATWLAIRETIDDARSLVTALEKFPIVFKTDPNNPITLCGGVDISQEIRTPEVTSAVSRISAWPDLRSAL
ncbi:MAG: (d)CMP kinase, partial [Actinomycetota bacterium]